MQQADMRIDPLDDLAVELEHQSQHAMRRRMMRAEVDRVILNLKVARVRLFARLEMFEIGRHCYRFTSSALSGVGAPGASREAFSSPGSWQTAPSHGLRQANLPQ